MPRSKSENGNSHFSVFGPFELPVTKSKKGARKIRRGRDLKEGLKAVAKLEYPDQELLWDKDGLYIYAIRRPGGSLTAYYVGMTSRQTLLTESLTVHKLDHYDDVLLDVNGTPMLLLIAPTDPGKTAVNKNLLEQIEEILIGRLYEMNKDIRNKRLKPDMDFQIDGVPLFASHGNMRRGRKSKPAAEMCRLIRTT